MIRDVDERLRQGYTDGRSSQMLLLGHRGSGKTSVLRKIEERVRETSPKAIIASVSLTATTDTVELVKAIVEDIMSELRRAVGIGRGVSSALEKIRTVSLGFMGTSATIERRARESPTSPIVVWKECMAELSTFPMLCICLDDADQLDKKALGSLKAVAETRSPIPVLLFATAGVEIRKTLDKMSSSPVMRIFSGAVHNIGEFTEEETAEALVAPLHKLASHGDWTIPAMKKVHQLTHGFPYLVQCFGRAAYREMGNIDLVHVQDSVKLALDIAGDWLDSQCLQSSDGDISAFVLIAGLGSFHLRTQEILDAGVKPEYISRLKRMGVLGQVGRGNYELLKAPAIAYYQFSKRHLA